MNKPNDKLNQAIEALQNSPVPQGPSDQLMRQTLNRVQQLQDQLPPASAGKRRFSMKTFTKFAIAACVLFAILGGITLIDKNSGIALADVAQRLQQAKAFFYKMTMTTSGEPLPGSTAPMAMDGSVWISNEYGMKMEMSMNGEFASITYLLPEQKKMVSVMPAMKKYMEVELNDDLLSKVKQQNQDPREWVSKMVDSQYQSLGKSTLDGIEVEGFESTDPALAGGVTEKVLVRLWVDAQTGMPVQMDMDMDMNEGKTKMHSVINDFQWNQDADPAVFVPQIPADFTPLPKTQIPKMDEESALAGFRKCLDILDRYPDNLSLATLMDDVGKIVKSKNFDPNQFKGMSQDQQIKWTMDQMLSIQSLGLFYMTLIQDKKDPAYYGKFVTSGDAKAILLRWKASDTTYRVIMGDLSATEMPADQLKQIESQMNLQEPPKPESKTSAITPLEDAASSANLGARVQSMTNIKKMLIACIMYAGKNNKEWPATLESLGRQDLVIKGYIYTQPKTTTPPSQTIAIYESFTDWGDGINVGFADGHVEFIRDQAQFQKLLAQ